MPELPEMETYRKMLAESIVGKPVTEVAIGREKSINVSVETFVNYVRGQRIERIDRRAKMLLFRLENGRTLLLHLMLGGSMFYGTVEEAPERSVQVRLSFGNEHLFFHGLRLGYLHLYEPQELADKLSKLGPEPLDPSFRADHFAARLRMKRGVLKSVLVDQSVLAGIGNCYSDELCFSAGVRPLRPIGELTERNMQTLYTSMHSTLAEAIRFGGYMETPLYVGDPLTGAYNDKCKVYDRGGEPCLRCARSVIQTEHNNRKVFYCEQCQS